MKRQYSIRSAVFSFFSRQRRSLAGLGPFLALESGQCLSALGTAMTSFALVIGPAFRLFLCALCVAQPVCRRAKRPMG